jgi:hypothetical protein
MPPSARRLGIAALLLPALLLGSCIKERRYRVMEDLDTGTSLAPETGVEIVGDVAGEAHFEQYLTLFARSNLQGVQGTLLSSADEPLLEERLLIPLLDPVLARLSAIANGTTRIGTAQRVAMGRAIAAAEELGADTLLAPRVEIVTQSLTFLVPLGWLYSRGVVEVRAKAVRLGSRPGETQAGDDDDR